MKLANKENLKIAGALKKQLPNAYQHNMWYPAKAQDGKQNVRILMMFGRGVTRSSQFLHVEWSSHNRAKINLDTGEATAL